MDQDGTWHGSRSQPRRLCVKCGPSLPSPKRGGAPIPIFGQFLFWTNCWVHQDATWYGGRPQSRGRCVRWSPPPPPQKKMGLSPQRKKIAPCLLWPNGCMDQDATSYVSRPRFTRYCVRWGPCSPSTVDLGPGHIVLDGVPASAKGAQQPPLFGPCLLCPRSPISATAELLL